MSEKVVTSNYEIKIEGLVQGVGFRPFIYRIAHNMNLKGWVENRNDGVLIKVSASMVQVDKFKTIILKEAPAASDIESINIKTAKPEDFTEFVIKKSENFSEKITEISPDIAVCDQCLEDFKNQPHRINYPFINCTNCGPRFTIINDLPYDRPLTTMNEFKMCPECKKEYEDVFDRRFHAQPVACNHCGPFYTMNGNAKTENNLNFLLNEISDGINLGKVYAIKGLGGFHLMCDALNNKAVSKLRTLKKRDGKPFAVMFKSIEEAKKYTIISPKENEVLTNWRKPIVLLKKKKELANEVCNGLNSIGVMLPYMPFHYLLFEKLKTDVIVLTSGNISDEPIIIDNKNASLKLNSKVDGIITYNREISNRTDDSVCMLINDKARIIRRSRGFVPQPIRTNLNTEGIFSTGAELVNSFAIGKSNQAILSQYIGDLKNLETYKFYSDTFYKFCKLFRFKPEIIVSDKHPNYLSSQFAQKLAAEKKIKYITVQHHHAHIASVMLDHKIDEKVIGISLDGIGLGTDGNIWGAEFMTADLTSFERKYHFEYLPMPGGDKATKEPWRMAVSYLYQTYGMDFLSYKLPIFDTIEKMQVEKLIQMIQKNINSPLASSAGRLFDAVAAIIGVTTFSSFHAEAPMRLEAIIDENIKAYYNFKINKQNISFKTTIQQIVEDKLKDTENGIISAKFHNTIIEAIITISKILRKDYSLNNVIFSGGTFQNKYITASLENALIKEKFKVYLPHSIPVNDQGIAIGQLAIAAKMREKGML